MRVELLEFGNVLEVALLESLEKEENDGAYLGADCLLESGVRDLALMGVRICDPRKNLRIVGD